jgi:archaellum component FlaF (FlaF/FlaG flagellin family)
MLSFDRDTAHIVLVIACIVGTLYLYREFNKAKDDMKKAHNTFVSSVIEQLQPPPPPVQKTVKTGEIEEVVESSE